VGEKGGVVVRRLKHRVWGRGKSTLFGVCTSSTAVKIVLDE